MIYYVRRYPNSKYSLYMNLQECACSCALAFVVFRLGRQGQRYLCPLETCSTIGDLLRQLGPTPTRWMALLLKPLETLEKVIKFTLVTVESVTPGFS